MVLSSLIFVFLAFGCNSAVVSKTIQKSKPSKSKSHIIQKPKSDIILKEHKPVTPQRNETVLVQQANSSLSSILLGSLLDHSLLRSLIKTDSKASGKNNALVQMLSKANPRTVKMIIQLLWSLIAENKRELQSFKRGRSSSLKQAHMYRKRISKLEDQYFEIRKKIKSYKDQVRAIRNKMNFLYRKVPIIKAKIERNKQYLLLTKSKLVRGGGMNKKKRMRQLISEIRLIKQIIRMVMRLLPARKKTLFTRNDKLYHRVFTGLNEPLKIVVWIRANNDAHIFLGDVKKNRGYEIVLGGWSNTRSVIRIGKGGSNIAWRSGRAVNGGRYIRFIIMKYRNHLRILRRNRLWLHTSRASMKVSQVHFMTGFGSTGLWNAKVVRG